MDGAEAAGTFGLLAGALSVLLPYFLGLAVALSILGAGIGLVRIATEAAGGPRGGWRAVEAWAPLAVGWTFFLTAAGPVAAFRGLALGASAIPLWLQVRRSPPFGGIG